MSRKGSMKFLKLHEIFTALVMSGFVGLGLAGCSGVGWFKRM